MTNRSTISICRLIWAVFVLAKCRSFFMDIKTLLVGYGYWGYLIGWGNVTHFLREQTTISRTFIQIIAIALFVLDVLVLIKLFKYEKEGFDRLSVPVGAYMATYIPRGIAIALAFLGVRGVRPHFLYFTMILTIVGTVLYFKELINERR